MYNPAPLLVGSDSIQKEFSAFPWRVLLVLGAFVFFFLSEFTQIIMYLGELMLLEGHAISELLAQILRVCILRQKLSRAS